MSSTHVRRSVRVSTAPKAFTYVTKEKKELIWSGSGIELSTVPCIVAKIKNTLARDAALKQIHSLMYRRVGSAKEAKKNILKFNGFNKEDLMNEHFLERVAQKMKKFSLANLKKIYDTLCLNRSSGTFGKTPTKDQLIERLTEWLAEPTEDLVVEPRGKKTKRHRKTKVKTKENTKRPRKSKPKQKQKAEEGDSNESHLLREAVEKAFKGIDLDTTSLRDIRRQVAADTGIDLEKRKKEFKQLVSEILST